MRYTLIIIVICCLSLCSCKDKKVGKEDGLITPVILNTNSFDNFKPGWATNEATNTVVSNNVIIAANKE